MGLLLAVSASWAAAQSHEVRVGDIVLRSSTVASDRIDPATASRHGIEPSPHRGVLNVVVLSDEGKAQKTLLAKVSAFTRNLAGVRTDIDLREVKENDRVSYMGTYEFAPREVLDFRIEARPAGIQMKEPLTLEYRERMWAR